MGGVERIREMYIKKIKQMKNNEVIINSKKTFFDWEQK